MFTAEPRQELAADHPHEDDFYLYLNQTLSKVRKTGIERHLSKCECCRETLDEMEAFQRSHAAIVAGGIRVTDQVRQVWA